MVVGAVLLSAKVGLKAMVWGTCSALEAVVVATGIHFCAAQNMVFSFADALLSDWLEPI